MTIWTRFSRLCVLWLSAAWKEGEVGCHGWCSESIPQSAGIAHAHPPEERARTAASAVRARSGNPSGLSSLTEGCSCRTAVTVKANLKQSDFSPMISVTITFLQHNFLFQSFSLFFFLFEWTPSFSKQFTVKSQIFVWHLYSYFCTFEKCAKFNVWHFLFALRPSNFTVILFWGPQKFEN